jgi:hypothetical protein
MLKLNNTQRFHVNLEPDFLYLDVDLDPTLKLDKFYVHKRTAERLFFSDPENEKMDHSDSINSFSCR